MRDETSLKLILEPWSQRNMEKLRLGGCGLINCGSRLGGRNTIGEEIDRILEERETYEP